MSWKRLKTTTNCQKTFPRLNCVWDPKFVEKQKRIGRVQGPPDFRSKTAIVDLRFLVPKLTARSTARGQPQRESEASAPCRLKRPSPNALRALLSDGHAKRRGGHQRFDSPGVFARLANFTQQKYTPCCCTRASIGRGAIIEICQSARAPPAGIALNE